MTAERQTDQKHVKIKYKPREQFRSFHNRKQRWSALVCHRRAGKTVATLNDLIFLNSWQQHPCRSPQRPLRTSHERGTSP